MKRYRFPAHRAAFALASAALTAVTLGLFVAVPAAYDSGAPQVVAAAPTVRELALNPSRIEVVAFRGRAEIAAASAGLRQGG